VEAIAPEETLASRYVLRSPIGDGRLTSVWTADDPTLARTVAVKFLHDDRAREPQVRDAFIRQATAGARLVHPNVLALYDAGTQDGHAFLVTEYVRGGALRGLLERRGPVDPGAAAEIMCGILSALSCAHDAGLVHGDLTSENVLVGAEGHVKVGDFGLAEAVRTASVDAVRTDASPYRAPEQVRGEEATPSTDVYAAGVLLAELLAGPAATSAPRGGRAPAPSAIRPGVPKRLDQVVERARAPVPADRYPSAAAMRAALERLGGERPSMGVADAIGPPEPDEVGLSRRSALRSWMLVPAIVVVLGAAAIVGGLALGRLEVGGPLGIRAAAPDSPAATHPPSSGAAGTIPIVSVRDVDPTSDGGDGSEHPEQTGLAIDGNAATAWTTDHYASADFGNLKPGVGLWLDFGGAASVRSVTITTPTPGWSVELIGGSHPDPAGTPLESPSGRTLFTVSSATTTITLQPARTDGILLWIRQLAPDGGRFSASVAEVSVSGTRG